MNDWEIIYKWPKDPFEQIKDLRSENDKLRSDNEEIRKLTEKAFRAGQSSGRTWSTNLWDDPCYTMDQHCKYKNTPESYSDWSSQHPILQHNS